MNVPECWVCHQPGKLRMDPRPVVVHDRGAGRKSRSCVLPPRDDRFPRITPTAGTPTWVEYYPPPWKEAS